MGENLKFEQEIGAERKNLCEGFINFLNETGSPYHTVAALVKILEKSGFTRIYESASWKLVAGGKYYVTRNYSSIMAFVIGQSFSSHNGGFTIVATHSDSPCLRLRPNNNSVKDEYLQVGVECYGGGLWHTWFDRGLGCAGKVVCKSENGKNGLEERLIRVGRPILIIPNLAIHLQQAEERMAFKINKESHLQPIICSKIKEILLNPKNVTETDSVNEERISPPLARLISKELNIKKENIIDVDLCLMDATPSRFCGIYEEFIESPRLDNLGSTWIAFSSLADMASMCQKSASINENDIAIVFAFDHEEIGSLSWVGAASNMLKAWLYRILKAFGYNDSINEILARSILISSDMAHALHPNYSEKHQKEHKIYMHKGIVLKENSNQQYTSSANTMAICRIVGQMHNVLIQNFAIRNDSPCGSTVGPILSARIGIRCVDIGIPQWAMHSCREICGTDDIHYLYKFIKGIFRSFREIDSKMIAI